MPSLAVRNARKAYGAVEVLHDIDIEIGDGEFLVLVGPSGCGKSTLLNIIAGLEEISAGAIEIDGRVVNDLAPKDRDIAMVFQSYALYPTMNVRKNIAFGLEMRGVPKAQRARKVSDVAELLQIGPLLDRKPRQLSGGQRQRVAMGRALVRDPKVFLFDEPLSNLDAKLRVEMRTEIKKLHQRLGTTIVYVTHDQIEAMTMATRIAVMNKGYLQQLGTPREIYDFPRNAFVATFMGSPPMNLVPATVSSETGVLGLRLEDGTAIPMPQHADSHRLAHGQEVHLGLRSEWISLAPTGGPTWSLNAEILVTEPTGPNLMALFFVGETEVTASLSGDSDIRPSDSVRLHADLSRALVFDAQSGDGLHRRAETTPIQNRRAHRAAKASTSRAQIP